MEGGRTAMVPHWILNYISDREPGAGSSTCCPGISMVTQKKGGHQAVIPHPTWEESASQHTLLTCGGLPVQPTSLPRERDSLYKGSSPTLWIQLLVH